MELLIQDYFMLHFMDFMENEDLMIHLFNKFDFVVVLNAI